MSLKSRVKRCLNWFRRKKTIPIYSTIDRNGLLTNKRVLVVGGTGGIGLAIAKRLKESKANVVITGSNGSTVEKALQELKNECKGYVLDLAKPFSFEELVELVDTECGPIDCFVCAAGIHIGREGLNFLNVTSEEFDKIFEINVRGTYFLSQTMARYFVERKIPGRICIISSQSALEPGWSPYRLSKMCVVDLVKGMAQQLSKFNIVVNGIGPGPTATKMQNYLSGDSIDTDQTPNERFTLPEEVAEFALLLISDLGDTISGQTIFMSGGRGVFEIR